MNKAYAILFGYDSEEELIGTALKNVILPYTADYLKNISCGKHPEAGETEICEMKGLKKNGAIFDIAVKTSNFRHEDICYTVIIIRDITNMKRNSGLQTMLTRCHQILLVVDKEEEFLEKVCQMITRTGGFHFTWAACTKNDGSELYTTGTDRENRYGGKLLMFISMKCISEKKTIMSNNLLSSPIDRTETEYLIRSGIRSLICLPISFGGDTVGALNIYSKSVDFFSDKVENLENLVEDISYGINYIRMKDRQKDLEKQLLHAQKMETIGTLAGGIAHDFNNIMTPILGYSEMILSHMSNENPLYKYTEQILAGAVRARELVRQILTFSHKNNWKKGPVSIEMIVRDTIKMLSPLLPPTIKINSNIDCSGCEIMGDAAQIHQVISNLCINSFHAMEEKGGILSVELRSVIVDREMKDRFPELKLDDYAELIIKDTGKGMTDITKERIFEPFFTTKPVGKGTGLGLSVAHGIIKNHNGSISVESEVQKGTAFRIFLPLLSKRRNTNEQEDVRDYSDKSIILLLDDNHEITELLKMILESSSYKVLSYNKPSAALENFRKNPLLYSLVITDLYMPEMNGIDFIRAVNRKRNDLPILIITAYDDILTENKKTEYNIQQIIYKPIFRNSFLEAVAECIKKEKL